VEATWLGNPEPHQKAIINSLVGTMMKQTNQDALIETHQMEPFEVQVQNPTRTICEKIMSLIRFSYSKDPLLDLKKKIRHIYDLHLLIENKQYLEFVGSENFSKMLHNVATDDIESYKNDNRWLEIHPKESLIFRNLKDTWKELESEYSGEFKNLVYGKLPESRRLLQSMEILKTEIDKLDWNIRIESRDI
jgi:hypothetical protein